MSRFNIPTPPSFTPNYAGGEAYSQSPELELISILLTSFGKDTYYRSGNSTFERLRELCHALPIDFVCKAGIYARTVFGMRTITHVLAAEIAVRLSGKPYAQSFYDKIVYRVDDMAEILAYYKLNCAQQSGGKRKSNKPRYKYPSAMMRGFAKAFDRFTEYHLAKYRSEDKDFKLVDVVNLVHPKPVNANGVALTALLKGTLRNTETWESILSAAKDATAKRFAWEHLILNKKLGYLALLRNLRNIMQDAPTAFPGALQNLTDPAFIKKSLILPMNYQTAVEEILKENSGPSRAAITYLNRAIDISCDNVPQFEGETLVVLDVSQSMTSTEYDGKPAKIGALFAAVLLKRNSCDFMTFDSCARYHNYNPEDSTLTLAKLMLFNGGATNFHAIFESMHKQYDRIIILSDMQGWFSTDYVGTVPKKAFNDYRKRTGADPFIYSFDLSGLGTAQFPERKVFALAGFSDKVFDIMQLLESDKNVLINKIKEVPL